MIHSDEQFLDQQEQEYNSNPEENYAEQRHNQDILQQEFESLPVIDLNSLVPSGEIVKIQVSEDKTDTLSVTSVDIANQIIEGIKEGRINPLDFAVKKKLVADAMDFAMKDPEVRRIMIEKVEKYGKQGATALGAKVSLTSRRSYTYSADPTWAAINNGMEKQKESLKEQENKIKAACLNGGSIMDEDGVIIASIVPAPETTSIAVSFAKKKK